ncbi:hypothetical protein IWQ60_006858 [Tieghemiomyces parasiticus]|uniref:Glycosyl hydrolase family 81 N-terminal domain-containing protein n=1 Tax=Tieghemiomyces parasiticus TaxID=78921 RepID=A0A9W8A778_9FUNG|nr:hypothetical protein IWQ60_006858 [Tieghemiomyces parasiticus]
MEFSYHFQHTPDSNQCKESTTDWLARHHTWSATFAGAPVTYGRRYDPASAAIGVLSPTTLQWYKTQYPLESALLVNYAVVLYRHRQKATGPTTSPPVVRVPLVKGSPYLTWELDNAILSLKTSVGIAYSIPTPTFTLVTLETGEEWMIFHFAADGLPIPATVQGSTITLDGRARLSVVRVAYLPPSPSGGTNSHLSVLLDRHARAYPVAVRFRSSRSDDQTVMEHRYDTRILTGRCETSPQVPELLMLVHPHYARYLTKQAWNGIPGYQSSKGDMVAVVGQHWVYAPDSLLWTGGEQGTRDLKRQVFETLASLRAIEPELWTQGPEVYRRCFELLMDYHDEAPQGMLTAVNQGNDAPPPSPRRPPPAWETVIDACRQLIDDSLNQAGTWPDSTVSPGHLSLLVLAVGLSCHDDVDYCQDAAAHFAVFEQWSSAALPPYLRWRLYSPDLVHANLQHPPLDAGGDGSFNFDPYNWHVMSPDNTARCPKPPQQPYGLDPRSVTGSVLTLYGLQVYYTAIGGWYQRLGGVNEEVFPVSMRAAMDLADEDFVARYDVLNDGIYAVAYAVQIPLRMQLEAVAYYIGSGLVGWSPAAR